MLVCRFVYIAEEKRRINWGSVAIINKLWSMFSFDKLIHILLCNSRIQFDLTACIKLMVSG